MTWVQALFSWYVLMCWYDPAGRLGSLAAAIVEHEAEVTDAKLRNSTD